MDLPARISLSTFNIALDRYRPRADLPMYVYRWIKEQMKHFILLVALLVNVGTAVSSDAVSSPQSYPMSEAIGCNMMVRGALPPTLTSVDLSRVEKITCACVDAKMREDVFMPTLFGTDQDAKKKIISRDGFQRYMIAKGMSYTFACIAPALSLLADETLK